MIPTKSISKIERQLYETKPRDGRHIRCGYVVIFCYGLVLFKTKTMISKLLTKLLVYRFPFRKP